MPRIYFLQAWFNPSGPAVEDALYESPSMRCFVGIDFGREPAPDETTVCRFRHLLERHGLGRGLFAETKRIHTVEASAANVADCRVLPALLHGRKLRCGATRGTRGRARRSANARLKQRTEPIDDAGPELTVDPDRREENRIKSKIRSRVEPLFALRKLKFGFLKMRFRGLSNNLHRLHIPCALINLCTARYPLLTTPAQSRA